MHKVVIADTSCLILFSKIKLTLILHSLYDEVILTPEVANEFGESLPDWIKIQQAKPENISIFEIYNIGKGEVSSLALAFELKQALSFLMIVKQRKLPNLIILCYRFFSHYNKGQKKRA